MIHVLQFSVKLSVLNQANVKETLLGLMQSVNVLKVIFIQVNVFLKPTQLMRIRLDCLKNSFRNIKLRAERSYINRTKRDMVNLSKKSPKNFWKKVNKFRKGKISSTDRVSIDKFVDHFKTISNTPHTDKTFDVPEIAKAINSMKRGKSPGVDGLVSDFFIDSKTFILPYLHKVYNYILETGEKHGQKG